MLVAVTLLNIGVIVVNGATDAPNAIATVVSTRAMKPKFAILMAAVCNFLGLLLVSLVTSAVAHTIFNMVDFGGNCPAGAHRAHGCHDRHHRVGCGGLVVRHPHQPKSHSLIAGLTGAAIALQGGFDAINGGRMDEGGLRHPAVHVAGLLLGVGELQAASAASAATWTGGSASTKFFRWAQIASGAGVAFMHGAQDGQKFMSIFVLAITLATGTGQADQMIAAHLAHVLLCARTWASARQLAVSASSRASAWTW